MNIDTFLSYAPYVVGGVFALFWIPTFFVVTRQKTANMIEQFGRYVGYRSAGLSLKAPWPFQYVTGAISLQIRELSHNVGVKSKDNAFLEVPVKVQFRVVEHSIEAAYYELEDAATQIASYVTNSVRSKANDLEMDEIFRSKNAFEHDVRETLETKFAEFGYEIINVLVDDPQPSNELKRAFDKVLAAKRDEEAAELEKAAIKHRLVGRAQAEAESLELKAKAYVNMRQTMAGGNSKAIQTFCQGLDITHGEALGYFEGLDMRDAIRDASRGEGSVVVIPADMGNHNAIGNIAALNRAGLGQPSSPTDNARTAAA